MGGERADLWQVSWKKAVTRQGRDFEDVSDLLCDRHLLRFVDIKLGPRTRLQQLVESAKEEHELEFLCGIEIEFLIMRPAIDGKPAEPVKGHGNTYSTASLRNPCLPILEEIARALTSAGIEVRQFHSEGGGPGFFEISAGT